MDYNELDDERTELKTEINLSSLIDARTLDIQALSLSHNFRPEIVRKLVLVRNSFTVLPCSIVQFAQLEELDVSFNEISWISGEIARLRKLCTLVARNNRLTNLPKEFQYCTSLESINLSGNLYTDIPPQIFSLRRLRNLYLGGNKIVDVPPQIENLRRLELLYLGGNRLVDIPPQFKRLKNLRHLFLCDNQLQSIPVELGRLKKLSSLSLHKNYIKTLPVEILMLVNLQELTLRDNPLVSTFIKKLEFTPPTLLELCGRTIKTNNVRYGLDTLPKQLISYLSSAKKCVNPKCDGVYFDSRVKCVQFMDFCGRFRLPLEQYLCSPNESEVCIDSSGVDAERLRRVLLPVEVVSTSESDESDSVY